MIDCGKNWLKRSQEIKEKLLFFKVKMQFLTFHPNFNFCIDSLGIFFKRKKKREKTFRFFGF